MLNTCFPAGSLEVCYEAGKRCLCDQASASPNKNRGRRVSTELPWLANTLHVLSPFVAGGIKLVLCDSWKLEPGFLDFFRTPFPARLALLPLAAITHCSELDYVLSPGSPPTESPNW